MHRILLAIGSNHNREQSAVNAKRLIAEAFDIERFSTELLTEPIGNGTYTEKYLNFLSVGRTDKSKEEVEAELKKIETLCGNSRELRNEGKVVMDIDLMQYDEIRLHKTDWQRGYIMELLGEISEK